MCVVGMKDPNMSIGPWVAPEDIKYPEDRWILMEAYRLMVCGRSLVIKNWKCYSMRSTFSTKQSRGQRSNPSSRTRQ